MPHSATRDSGQYPKLFLITSHFPETKMRLTDSPLGTFLKGCGNFHQPSPTMLIHRIVTDIFHALRLLGCGGRANSSPPSELNVHLRLCPRILWPRQKNVHYKLYLLKYCLCTVSSPQPHLLFFTHLDHSHWIKWPLYIWRWLIQNQTSGSSRSTGFILTSRYSQRSFMTPTP